MLENETAKKKEEQLTKWDWLEREYQQKCHAAHVAEQSLQKAEKKMKEREELLTMKNQQIQQLEKSIDKVAMCIMVV